MKKILLLMILCLSLFNYAYSQTGYYATNESLVSGVDIKAGTDLDNAKFFVTVENGEFIQHYPGDIAEYGLSDGRIYISYEILTGEGNKRVFLQQLVSGNYKLFYLRESNAKRYFFTLPGEESLVELNDKRDFKRIIEDNGSGCEDVSKALKLTNLKRNSLIRFFRGLNSCDFFPLERRKIGLSVGVSNANLFKGSVTGRYLTGGKYNYDQSFSFGILIEWPIELSGMRFLTGLGYYEYDFSNHFFNTAGEIETRAHFNGINIPFLVKQVFLREKSIRPYYQLGFEWKSNINNSNDISVVPTSINRGGVIMTDTIDEEEINSPFVANNYFGYSIGLGMELNINHRNEIRLDSRYTHYIGFNNHMSIGELTIMASYIF